MSNAQLPPNGGHTFTYVTHSDPPYNAQAQNTVPQYGYVTPCLSCHLGQTHHAQCRGHTTHYSQYQAPLGPQPLQYYGPHGHTFQYQAHPNHMHYGYPQAHYPNPLPAVSVESVHPVPQVVPQAVPLQAHPHNPHVHGALPNETTSIYYGRTRAQVDFDRQQIARNADVWRDQEMVPYKPANDQQFWVVDLDGSHILCNFETIETAMRPGQWRKDPLHGNSYFVRTEPDA